MTGYGKAEYIFADHKTIVELRSLNSKQLDLSLKTAPLFRDKELDLRNLVREPLERGKVDMIITTQPLDGTQMVAVSPVDWQALKAYAADFKAHAAELGLSADTLTPELLSTLLRLPGVVRESTASELSNEEWQLLQTAVRQALDRFLQFRAQEGAALQRMFEEKLSAIQNLLAEVEPFEKGRVEHIREHLLDNLELLSDKTKQAVDMNRLEQEMIYYLEKLDITEEKVRLTNHIRYFRECMDASGKGVGKQLGFVAQEMGREINTLGSKSNQSEMQILVVKMKDLLEQIKEQVLNVL